MANISLVLLLVDDKILLFRRTGHEVFDGLYGMAGGHVEENESLIDGAKREVREETGLNIPNPLYINSYKYNKDKLHIYAARIPNTNGITLNDEHDGFKLFSPEELKSPEVIPTTKFMYHDLMSKNLKL